MAFTASELETPVSGSRSAVSDLSSKLLRLEASASRHRDHRLTREEVAEVLPELVRFDAQGQPRAVRHRLLSSLLLEEVRRLSERVAELEAGDRRPRAEQGAEPLVRITVARHE